jgi:HKD family nuclease
MDIITNETSEKHLDTLRDLINKSEKILISVAFLKKSGLDLVITDLEVTLKKGAEVKIYCGLDFYFTEPDALREILILFNKYRTGKLYLYKSDNAFHPKVYCFINRKTASILIGSANFTKGGFQDNIEVSTLETTTIGSSIYNKVNSFFKTVEKYSVKANELEISQYKRKYDIIHKKLNKASREAEKEIKAITKLDISKIMKHLAEYKKDKDEQDNFKEKLSNYKKAKKILDEICDKSISSEKEFMDYYEKLVGKEGQHGLWHSGGLFRQKNRVASDYKTFIKMVREVRDNIGKSPKEVFEIGLKYVKKVRGLGVNVLTEIMNTYDSKQFAVLNNNPLTSLKFFGFSKFPDPNNFKPDTYEIYNSLISEFMKVCGFKSMGQVDHFLNYIYWRYAKK